MWCTNSVSSDLLATSASALTDGETSNSSPRTIDLIVELTLASRAIFRAARRPCRREASPPRRRRPSLRAGQRVGLRARQRVEVHRRLARAVVRPVLVEPLLVR